MSIDQKILQKLNEIGIALSKERDIPRLLEKILTYAKELTNADGGTMYTVTPHNMLHFEITISDSLGFRKGGTSNKPIPFPNLPLFLEDGSFNDSLMVAYAVNHKKIINIQDAYFEKGFDFSGTRAFDERIGYRTKSVLTIPIKNHEDEVIAVLQLINPKDGNLFTPEDVQLAESLASQAGVALTNQLLILNLKKLFESLIRVVAEAVDEKSPSTGNHGKRVPVVALLLAQAVSETESEPFKNTHFSQEELYELEVASFLHDCGKITTPVYIVEKRSKLQTIFDRIELVKVRFKLLEAHLENQLSQKKLQWFESNYPKEFASAEYAFSMFEREWQAKLKAIHADLAFLERCNEGKEPITDSARCRLYQIAQSTHPDAPLLTEDEIENLCIRVGNLTEKERNIIKHHVVMTYRMLSQLNFPKELKKVPEIAAAHHERMDGKGYPLGLKGEEMSIQARILAIADVFEALSAPDRPYKEALPLSAVFKTMQTMVEDGHLDPDLFRLFVDQKVYLPYARQYLTSEQIDI